MDAAADLATIVDTVEATRADLAELRHRLDVIEARLGATATKADIAELKAETKADIAELKAETKADIAELKAETKADIAELRAATKGDITLLKAEVAGLPTKAELKDALLVQTRWILGGLALVLLAILFKA